MAHTLREFQDTIRHMPLMQQACISKRTTWERFAPHNRELRQILNGPGNDENAMICREELFELGRNGPSAKFLYATYIWGYPNGGRGRCARIIEHKRRILRLLQTIHGNAAQMDWPAICSVVTGIPGLGVSTFTKLLYFMRITVCGKPALILDNKIIEVFKRGVFPEEFGHLAGVRYDNAMQNYPEYLSAMAEEAEELDVEPGKLEMFLFAFGGSLKN